MEGFEGLIVCVCVYGEVGVDILFFEVLIIEEEMCIVCDVFDKLVMVNMVNGGLILIFNVKLFVDIGYSFVIYLVMISFIVVSVMEVGLCCLKEDGDGELADILMFDFKEFCGMIGF